MDQIAPLPGGRASYQRHHIVPLSLARRPQMASFFAQLGTAGFRLSDARHNLVLLPCDEHVAAATGQALHRGPHPAYTSVVAARIERIRQRHVHATRGHESHVLHDVRRLQRVMVRVLAGRGPRLLALNRRDPMRLFADYSALDNAITMLLANGSDAV
jgi:hypothetical protein